MILLRSDNILKLLTIVGAILVPIIDSTRFQLRKKINHTWNDWFGPKRLTLEEVQIHEEIGKGSYGKVYAATCNRYAAKLAVKVVHIPHAIADDIRNHRTMLPGTTIINLSQEGEKYADVNSPWVIPIYFYFRRLNYLIFATLLADGGAAENAFKEAGFSDDHFRIFIAEAILALHHLHLLGYLHNDVHFGNFLGDAFGHTLIGDLGSLTTKRKVERNTEIQKNVDFEGLGKSIIEDWPESRQSESLISLADALKNTKENENIDALKNHAYFKEGPYPINWALLDSRRFNPPPFPAKQYTFRQPEPQDIISEMSTDDVEAKYRDDFKYFYYARKADRSV